MVLPIVLFRLRQLNQDSLSQAFPEPNPIKVICHRHAQRLASEMILDLVQLTVWNFVS